jgi:hypothetical protein
VCYLCARTLMCEVYGAPASGLGTSMDSRKGGLRSTGVYPQKVQKISGALEAAKTKILACAR